MAKIRLTKNELKKQKDNLKRFTRFLPTLELKKKQLLQEVRKAQLVIEDLYKEFEKNEKQISRWAGVFAEDFDIEPLIKVEQIVTDTGNIAGIDIPVFKDIKFEEISYDFITTPLWVDYGIEAVKEQLTILEKIKVVKEQLNILQNELRNTIQRIKLFEEVKIPEARENIRIIRIFLADLQTAEVVRGKIAKSKIAKKKSLESLV
ncbi:V-type ATP synthase subunit D [candidate division KSB1 bacterium]|nr:MAG: V-type ATP synthase subunit D [candidate division KSB1 bacterium]